MDKFHQIFQCLHQRLLKVYKIIMKMQNCLIFIKKIENTCINDRKHGKVETIIVMKMNIEVLHILYVMQEKPKEISA